MSSNWPVDPDGEEGSEGMRKFDMRIIADKVDEAEDFPMDRDEFVAEYGDYPIRINYETVVPMSEIFSTSNPKSSRRWSTCTRPSARQCAPVTSGSTTRRAKPREETRLRPGSRVASRIWIAYHLYDGVRKNRSQ